MTTQITAKLNYIVKIFGDKSQNNIISNSHFVEGINILIDLNLKM